MNFNLEYCKDPSFRIGDICRIILTFFLSITFNIQISALHQIQTVKNSKYIGIFDTLYQNITKIWLEIPHYQGYRKFPVSNHNFGPKRICVQ